MLLKTLLGYTVKYVNMFAHWNSRRICGAYVLFRPVWSSKEEGQDDPGLLQANSEMWGSARIWQRNWKYVGHQNRRTQG